MAYCRDVLEELVGVAEACRRDHRGAGRQGASHKVRILDPQVGAEHSPVAGAVVELAQGTPLPHRPHGRLGGPSACRLCRHPRPLPSQGLPPHASQDRCGPEALGGAKHACCGERGDTDTPAAKGDGRGVRGLELLPQRPEQPREVSQGLLHRQQLRVPAPCGPLPERQRLSVVTLQAGGRVGGLTLSPQGDPPMPHPPARLVPTCSAKTTKAPCCAASSRMNPELLAKDHTSPSLPV